MISIFNHQSSQVLRDNDLITLVEVANPCNSQLSRTAEVPLHEFTQSSEAFNDSISIASSESSADKSDTESESHSAMESGIENFMPKQKVCAKKSSPILNSLSVPSKADRNESVSMDVKAIWRYFSSQGAASTGKAYHWRISPL